MSVETFFNKFAPEVSKEVEQELHAFVQRHCVTQCPVALVTSGGTTVPLERNTVRFLDNFSGGNRGSASAEALLKSGYAVIFLHRRNSLMPFSRQLLVHTEDQIFDFLCLDAEGQQVRVRPEHRATVHRLLLEHDQVVGEGRLLKLGFTSVSEYLALLRACSTALQPCRRRALVYLAAAVSDFYLPEPSTHKIQSSSGGLTLQLQPVPKTVDQLTSSWSPHAFVCTFKLETDPGLLQSKAVGALHKYKHQCVIANLLSDYKQWVHVYTAAAAEETAEPQKIERTADQDDLEPKLIQFLVSLHEKFIAAAE